MLTTYYVTMVNNSELLMLECMHIFEKSKKYGMAYFPVQQFTSAMGNKDCLAFYGNLNTYVHVSLSFYGNLSILVAISYLAFYGNLSILPNILFHLK